MAKRRTASDPRPSAAASADGTSPNQRRSERPDAAAARDDALELARSTFIQGKRVDMQALARQLWVSRATLYRWVGTRERLLSEVLDDLALDLAGKAEAEAEGEGNARVLDFVRRLMKAATRSEPIRAFVAREPELARRLILSERGPVHKRLVHGLTLVLADTRGPDPAPALVEFADLVVQFGTAVGWATLAIGDSPRIERTVDLARVLLEAPRKTDGAPAGGRVGPGLIGESR